MAKNKNIPSSNELPSMGKLVKSTILAIILASIILVTIVLPAEYGIDPIGVGEMIGLAKMGQIKVSLAQEAAMEDMVLADVSTHLQDKQNIVVASDEKASKAISDFKCDTLSFNLQPNEGKEIKLTMAAETTVKYLWYTNGAKANFDVHADSKKLDIKYHNYEKGKLQKSEGIMKAAFDGNHGWFWRNRTSETMVVTLEVNGNYTGILQF